ncbi:MAG: argininosuccinate synthase [bacterium]
MEAEVGPRSSTPPTPTSPASATRPRIWSTRRRPASSSSPSWASGPAGPRPGREITLRVEAGEVVAINGQALSPLAAMRLANDVAGRNGIWMKNALENRVVGTKSRGVYEAPGMELLGFAVRAVYRPPSTGAASASSTSSRIWWPARSTTAASSIP